MLFEVRRASPALCGVVRQHQLMRFHFEPGSVVPAKPYWPRPAAALAFYLRAPEVVSAPGQAGVKKPRAVFIGQPTVVTLRQVGHDFAVYQIELQPGVLHRLTGLSMQDLMDRWVDAEAVLPVSFRALIRQLEDLADGDADTIIATAEAWLWSLWSHGARHDHAADLGARWLIANPGLSVDSLADRLALSARQLRRAFIHRIGGSPKLLARVARFDTLVRLKNRAPHEDWLTAALEAGYYDHQHLRRDFLQFTQTSPTEFMALERTAPERSFGLRET